MSTIKARVDASVPHPSHKSEDCRAAEQRADGTKIPAQQVDFQLGPALDQPQNKVAETQRSFRFIFAAEIDAGVEIPADEHNTASCRQHRQAASAEIIVGIDDKGSPASLSDAPGVGLDGHEIKALRRYSRLIVHEGHAIGDKANGR